MTFKEGHFFGFFQRTLPFLYCSFTDLRSLPGSKVLCEDEAGCTKIASLLHRSSGSLMVFG
jgi:hypothetical protein